MSGTAAIVGLGSRGLSVLERIVTLAKRAGPAIGELRVVVIDPRCDGAGVHDIRQPDYLLLNTTCAQVSMFPDACTVGEDVDAAGPSLYDWVQERGLRLSEDGFTVTGTGREIRPFDFLPRRLLGEYLGWVFAEVCRRAPAHVRITMHRAAAADLASGPHEELSITLSDGTQVFADHVFLTTGYTPNADGTPQPGFLAEPYPLPERLADVTPGQSVAIDGFGLSAMDMMSCLTVGRGGRFVGSSEQMTYVPSGREPTMLFYSRSGVPCRARPLVVTFAPKYQPLVLTHEAIDRLRDSRGGRLDFDQDLLPLVLTEMRIAYRRRQVSRGQVDPDVLPALTSAATAAQIAAVLDELDRRFDPFDPRTALDGGTGMVLSDAGAYQQWLAGVIRSDLAEGLLGFVGSPFKAALDILRDLRDTFRHMVDFGGLTEQSLDEFNRRTIPVINRAVVGPQYERHTELLALFDAGVARAPFGPGPDVTRPSAGGRWRIASTSLREPHIEEVDWVAAAHVPLPAVATSASPFLQALYRRGWIRPYRSAGPVVGIDVDPGQHPVRADGRSDQRIWVLGPLCEGATFYNNLVPSPDTYSRPIFDAHRCVASMMAQLCAVPLASVEKLPVRAPAIPAV